MKSFLLKALNVEPAESSQVSYLLGLGFAIGIFLASYDVVSITLFVREFDEATQLPIAVVVGGGIAIVFTYIYSQLQTRVSFRGMAIGWIFLMLLLVVGTYYRIETTLEGSYDRQVIYFTLFTLAVPFNFISLLIFWGAFGRLFNLRQAKRIIGGIDSGQLVASIVALFSIGLLVESLRRTEDILLLSAAAVLGMFVTFFLMSGKHKLVVQSGSGQVKLQRLGIPKMIKDKYISLMMIFVIISMVAVLFMDYAFVNVAGAQYPGDKEFGSFVAYFEATVVIFSFLFQTFVTDWIISNYGLKIALIINPILTAILTGLAVLIGFSVGYTADEQWFIYFFLIIAGSKLFIDSLKDALDGPSFKLYFLPIDSSVKFDVQTKIDGLITAFAGVMAGSVIILMNNFQLQFIYIIIGLVPILIIWYFITLKMHHNYKETLQLTLNKTKGDTEEEKTNYSINSVLQHEVESEKEDRVIYGLKLMERLDPALFETSILKFLDSDSGKIKEFATESVKSLDLEYEDPEKSEIKELASRAKGMAEMTEVLSIPSSRLHALGTSIKMEDRLLAAKLLRRLIDAENIFILLDLLRDQDPKVRMAAIATARKVKRPETWPVLIELLNSSTYSHAAVAALVEAGTPCLFTLETAFHRSGQTQKVMLKIVQIMTRIGGDEAFQLMWKKIDFHDRKIVKQILQALRFYHFQANEQQFPVIRDLLDAEIGKAIWNMAAISELPSDENNKNLIEALEEEIASNFDHMYMLLCLLYDPKQVILIKHNIETGTADGIGLGIELFDLFLHPDLKPKLFPLIDDISINDRVRQLQIFYPREKYSHHEVINYIINRDYNQINRWTRALALKSTEDIDDFKVSKGIVAQLFNPDYFLMETAAWIIYKKDKRTYQRVSQRLDESVKRNLDEKLFSTFFFESFKDDFPLTIDKIMFLKNIPVFSQISGILLSQIVDRFRTLKLKDGAKVELYDEDNDKPIFIVGKGSVTLYHEDDPLISLKEKDVFGDIFTMDESKSTTSLTVKGETIIFQITLNDFFDVMANQHELAQSFISNISSKFIKQETAKS